MCRIRFLAFLLPLLFPSMARAEPPSCYFHLPAEVETVAFGVNGGEADSPVKLAVVDAVNTLPVMWQVHVDHLNRPIRMTDAAKASVWDVVWSPWGSPYSVSGTATLDARFPGQWYQLESGLHYNWHRHYDPSLGRYTQPDPLGFVDGPSVYGYAGGSPIAYFDFTGANRSGRWRGGRPPNPGGPTMDFRMGQPRSQAGGIEPVLRGRQGEEAVRAQCDIGDPRGIEINGRNRQPDGLKRGESITEIKNRNDNYVTQQIRDYLDYAQKYDLRFDYYYRPGSHFSRTFQDLRNKGLINAIPIPQQ